LLNPAAEISACRFPALFLLLTPAAPSNRAGRLCRPVPWSKSLTWQWPAPMPSRKALMPRSRSISGAMGDQERSGKTVRPVADKAASRASWKMLPSSTHRSILNDRSGEPSGELPPAEPGLSNGRGRVRALSPTNIKPQTTHFRKADRYLVQRGCLPRPVTLPCSVPSAVPLFSEQSLATHSSTFSSAWAAEQQSATAAEHTTHQSPRFHRLLSIGNTVGRSARRSAHRRCSPNRFPGPVRSTCRSRPDTTLRSLPAFGWFPRRADWPRGQCQPPGRLAVTDPRSTRMGCAIRHFLGVPLATQGRPVALSPIGAQLPDGVAW